MLGQNDFDRTIAAGTDNSANSDQNSQSTTIRTKTRNTLIRPALDAIGVFAILCILCLSIGTAPSSASPNAPRTSTFQSTAAPMTMKAVGEADVQPVVEIATTSSPANPDAVYRRTSAQAAWTLLMIGLSITAALNLALLRHLRGAYAQPRGPTPGPNSGPTSVPGPIPPGSHKFFSIKPREGHIPSLSVIRLHYEFPVNRWRFSYVYWCIPGGTT